MAKIGKNQENKGNERKLRETGCVTKGFALAGLASMYLSFPGGPRPDTAYDFEMSITLNHIRLHVEEPEFWHMTSIVAQMLADE